MNTDMTLTRLSSYREHHLALLSRWEKEVTPGPWESYNDNEEMEPQFNPLWCVANDAYHNPNSEELPAINVTLYSGCEGDSVFIASSRALLPAAIKSNLVLMDALEKIAIMPEGEQVAYTAIAVELDRWEATL